MNLNAVVFKRRDFAKWQAREKLPDSALCAAVREMQCGLIDAQLGVHLYKMRVARPGQGKSGAYRTLVSARIGTRYLFLHGFSKNDKANITHDERKALQIAGKAMLGLSGADLLSAVRHGILFEVCCDQQTH